MAKASTLLDVVSDIRPGVRVELLSAGKYMVVGFHAADDKVWIPLSYRPDNDSPESLLGSVANMMACCLNCDGEADWHCHFEHRVLANKMRKFLGDAGFLRFLENAPIVTGQPAETKN
jgi:hypothetical protein